MKIKNELVNQKEVDCSLSPNNSVKEKIFSINNTSNHPKESTKLCNEFSDLPKNAEFKRQSFSNNNNKKFSSFFKINKRNSNTNQNLSSILSQHNNSNSLSNNNMIINTLRSCDSENNLISNNNNASNLDSNLNIDLRENINKIKVNSSISKLQFSDNSPNEGYSNLNNLMNSQNTATNKNLVDSIFYENSNTARSNFQSENALNKLNNHNLKKSKETKEQSIETSSQNNAINKERCLHPLATHKYVAFHSSDESSNSSYASRKSGLSKEHKRNSAVFNSKPCNISILLIRF